MKQFVHVILLLFAFIGGARAEETISIGTGTETTMTTPFSSGYNYSFVEQIYTADEMKVGSETVAGTISSISFYLNVTSTVATPRTYDIVVYMKNVTRSTFPGDDAYESVSASDIVFNGTWTIPARTGWVTITLDTPFWYDGQSNLLIAIDENSSGYSQHSFSYTWKDNSVITFESNNATNPDPYDLASYISGGGRHYRIGYRANIQIAITPTTCDTPGTLMADPVTANAATLKWTGTSDAYNVQYKKASETNWTDALTNSTATTTTLSGLDAGTLYNARVQGVCSNMISKWKTITFSTAGDAITTFPWSENFESYSTGDFFTPGWLNQHFSGEGSDVFQINATNIGGNSTKKLMLPLQKSGEYSQLRLPVMNLPGNNYELVLNIYRSNNNSNPSGYSSEGIMVYVSNDGSFKNNQVAFIPRQYNSDAGTVPAEEATGWYTYEIPIGQSGPCYIFLLGLSQNCAPTYLDNLVVKEMPTCMKPTGLTCSATTITTATLSWSLQDATQTAWDVQVATNADFSEGTRLVENVDVHDSYQLGGLSPETTFFVRVRGNCGGGDVSDWSNTVSFTTPVACVVPTGLKATLTPGNGTIATLSWTENGDDTDWVLEYGTAADFTGATSVNVSGTPSCALTGLTAEATYYARVKAVEGEYQSAWSSAMTFMPTNVYVVTVNDGTSTTVTAPLYGNYKSSYVQMIYTASQLESAGISGPCTINRICFNSKSANTQARKPVIYICHAPDDKSSFGNNTDFVSINEFTKVYDYTQHGEWNITADWNEFELDTPFTYDGSSNLVIAVHCGLVDTYSGSNFYSAQTSASQVLYAYSDTSDPVPSTYEGNWGGYNGTKNISQYLPSLKLYYDPVAVSCPKPTGLSAGTPGAHDVTLSWTEAGSADEWVLQYGTDNSFATYTEVTTGFAVSGTTVTATLSNLAAETTYYVRVKAVCGGGDESFWSRISFTTPVACLVPTDLACSETTTNSATLSWTENGQTSFWEICLNDDETDIITAATNPYTLTGLNASSSYTAKVRAVNSLDERSAWSAALNFNTACGAVTSFPWSENFESYDEGDFIHTCWVNEHISGNGSYIFKIDTSDNGTNGTHQLQLPDMSEGTLTKLVLPEMTLPGDNYQFVFDVYRSSSTYNSSYQVEGIRVFASTDGNIEGATEVAFIPRHYQVSNTVIPAEAATGWYTYELPIPMSGTCYIILRGESQYCTSTYMDNFVVEEAPVCLKPTGLTASEVKNRSAVLDWESDAGAWDIDVNGTLIENVTTKPYTLTDLTPETDYTVKVRTNCGGGSVSKWSNEVSFTTLVACPAPTNLDATLTPGNGTVATLSWTENGEATNWVLEYGTANDFTGATSVNVSGTPSQELTGLTEETTYYARVKAVNSYNEESAWSDIISFEPTTKTVIGSGTGTVSGLPFDNYFKYSLTQQIYTVAELGDAGVIESIDFYKNNTTTANRTLDIYMVCTDKSSFESGSDWIAVTAADLVFSGSVSFLNNAWTTITLDEGFIYDGSRNVAIVVNDKTGSYSGGSSQPLLAFDVQSQAIYVGADANSYDPTALSSTSGTVKNMKNQIRIVKSPLGDCMKPTNFKVTELNPGFVTLSWTENGNATNWVIDCNGTTVTVTENPYTLTGLTPETDYTVKVRPACDENLWSSEITFTTPADNPVPTDLAVTGLTHNSATVSWTGYGDSYNVRYKEANVLGTSIYSEGFESGTIPNGWTIEGDNQDASKTWSVGVGDFNTSTGTHSGSYNAKITHNTKGYETYLITPAMDLSGQSNLMLSFWYVNRKWTGDIDGFGVYYRVGTGEWNELWTTSEAHETWTNQTVELTGLAADYQIGFKMTDGYGRGVGLDDIVIANPVTHDWETVADLTEKTISLTGLKQDTGYEVQVQSVKGGETTDWSSSATFTTLVSIELANDDSGFAAGLKNSDIISSNDGKSATVTLKGRTLYKDGEWNTLCLPFDLTLADSPLAGAIAKTLDDATMTGTTVTLTFGTVDELEAGVPYIIKWTGGENIVDPVFTGVTVVGTDPMLASIEKANGYVKFIGYYDAFGINTPDDDDIYYMTSGNKLKHTGKARTLYACRAYFQFSEDVTARQFVLDFNDGQATSISESVAEGDASAATGWYTVDGRKLLNAPKRKGMYIHNGAKVVVK